MKWTKIIHDVVSFVRKKNDDVLLENERARWVSRGIDVFLDFSRTTVKCIIMQGECAYLLGQLAMRYPTHQMDALFSVH